MSTKLILATLLAALLVMPPEAEAHEWYPGECCSGTDCAPVTNVEFMRPLPGDSIFGVPPAHAAGLQMFVTTKHGTVVVPENFPRRESKDNRLHACMNRSDGSSSRGDQRNPAPFGQLQLRCIFIPPLI